MMFASLMSKKKTILSANQKVRHEFKKAILKTTMMMLRVRLEEHNQEHFGTLMGGEIVDHLEYLQISFSPHI